MQREITVLNLKKKKLLFKKSSMKYYFYSFFKKIEHRKNVNDNYRELAKKIVVGREKKNGLLSFINILYRV